MKTSKTSIPAKLRRQGKQLYQYWQYKRTVVRYRSNSTNVYHCCVHRTASQWLRRLLSDLAIYSYSGLEPYHYQSKRPGGIDERKITERAFSSPFPTGTIVSPLYIDFDNYAAVPKPDRFKAFFVMRDPRDVVVSWYFAMRYSHHPSGKIPELRESLNRKPTSEGLIDAIGLLDERGLFDAIGSWWPGANNDPRTLVVRYEDLTAETNFRIFRTLFDHCDIRLPDEVLQSLLTNYSFEQISKRKRGEEKLSSHYRKGISGDWRNYFDDGVMEAFKKTTSDLITQLGYSW